MKLTYPLLMAGMCCVCSCSSTSDETPSLNENNVRLQIILPGWNDAGTRAPGDMLYPVTLIVTTPDNDDISHTATINSGNEFNLNLSNGTYEIYAVCGLPANVLPKKLSTEFTIPDAEKGGKAEFAKGTTSVTVANGASATSTLSITATRQVALLDVKITGVPSNIKDMNLYVQGLYETYRLDTGWKITADGANRLTQIPLTKNSEDDYESKIITLPCSSTSGVKFIAESKTESGYSYFLTYTTATPMPGGTHLVEELKYKEMVFMDGNLSLDDWNTVNDNGTIQDTYPFAVGDQYFSQPATVFYVDDVRMSLFPHKAMTVTLSEVKGWNDYSRIAYDKLPGLLVNRYAFPTSVTAPNNFLDMISSVGLDKLNKQIKSTGNAPIDIDATNVLAYYDKEKEKFYRFDFRNKVIKEVEGNPTTEFLLYPVGVVDLVQ